MIIILFTTGIYKLKILTNENTEILKYNDKIWCSDCKNLGIRRGVIKNKKYYFRNNGWEMLSNKLLEFDEVE